MKRLLVLLLATLAGFVGPAPTAIAGPPPSALTITTAVNFRDVAGTGIVTKTGHMKTGVVYRSARLSDLSDADIAQLEGLGITDIYDLRTSSEVKAHPDKDIAATNHPVSLFAGHSLSSKKVNTAARARAYMREMNRRFVTVSAQRGALRTVLLGVALSNGPVIIHCAAGKDRTGWVSAMLQYIAGASDTVIVKQYLLSNDYRAAQIAQAKRTSKVAWEKEHLRPSYLQAGLAKARAKYGSLKKYLIKGVGLTESEYAALQLKLQTA